MQNFATLCSKIVHKLFAFCKKFANFGLHTKTVVYKPTFLHLMQYNAVSPTGYDALESYLTQFYALTNNINAVIDSNREYNQAWVQNLDSEVKVWNDLYSRFMSATNESHGLGYMDHKTTEMFSKISHMVRQVVVVYHHPARNQYEFERAITDCRAVIYEALMGWYFPSLRLVVQDAPLV